MPLNVRRLSTSALGFFLATSVFGLAVSAQAPPLGQPVAPPVMGPPTSGDIMRDRISKSKAYIAVRNYNAAIYELENIRKESGDAAVQGVVNVLLMNSYLEQGDYKRAQDLLNEFYAAQKTTKPNAAANYSAVAAQVIKSGRSRAERYKALGLNIADRTLPLEALNDLEKMRETLELVITQSKEAAAKKERADETMAMLEEASRSRAMLARDDYDSRRWTEEVADTRESMANGGSVVMNAVAGSGSPELLAVNSKPAEPIQKPLAQPPVQQTSVPVYQATQTSGQLSAPTVSQPVNQPVDQSAQPVAQPVSSPAPAVVQQQQQTQPAGNAEQPVTREREVKIVGSAPASNAAASNDKPAATPQTESKPGAENVADAKPAGPAAGETAKSEGPINVGLLMPYATNQAKPVYPAAAKVIRQSGVVKVEVTIGEDGSVSEVQKVSGPMMLQGAAKDAILKWRFRPFTRDGQPVKATGFVNFSFAL